MIHLLCDFSYTERAVTEVWLWLWFIHRVWSTDRFSCLQLHKIRNFDLKSIITLLIIIMLPVQCTFDITWTYLKYNEGFIPESLIEKPAYFVSGNEKVPLWSKEDLFLKTITEYVLACSFAFQVGTLALMQAFWHHLASQVEGKPFIRSWKFRLYVIWFILSLITFPAARGLVSNDVILVETIPQFLFSIQMFIIFLLGIQNGKKLNNLLRTIQHQRTTTTGRFTIIRIYYFMEMNYLLQFGAFLVCIGLFPITLDAISRFNFLNQSKFFMDLFSIHANFGCLVLWTSMILIIYPRYYITGLSEINPQSEKSENDHVSIQSLESKKSTNSFTINLTSLETTLRNQSSNASNEKVIKSVNSLLEHQQQQIEIYRHKTSMSTTSSCHTS